MKDHLPDKTNNYKKPTTKKKTKRPVSCSFSPVTYSQAPASSF